jgi:glutamate N-acetyltransferase/amino-acid N-acetyltransferase
MRKNLTNVRGFRVWGAHIGIKSKRRDLALIVSQEPASAAGVFTKNKVIAAPVKVTKDNIRDGTAQAIVITSGNANACTGKKGLYAAETVAATLSNELKIPKESVLVSATGVIGEPYPIDKVIKGIKKHVRNLSKRNIAGTMTANAIMTTDTFQKETYLSFRLGKTKVNMAGIAKGAGMIHPDMATMLAFIVCDAEIDPSLLQESLNCAVDKTFNMISIDGDTSTNDMVLVLSNGLAGNKRIKEKNQDYKKFSYNLKLLCRILAKSIVSDGEGATKFIEYKVVNAASQRDAIKIVRTISNSNLIRTALFGRDPNWGRIIAAVGRAGVDVDPDKIDISIGSKRLILVAKDGGVVEFNKRQLKQMLKSSRLKVQVDLNGGQASAMGWGTDLSYEYIRINAEYTT